MKKVLFALFASVLVVAGCNNPQQADNKADTKTDTPEVSVVEQGDTATLQYVLSWYDDSILASNTDVVADRTSSFIESMLSDEVVAGDDESLLWNAIVWAKVGETIYGRISHREMGFHEFHDQYKVQKVPLKLFTINQGAIPNEGDRYENWDQNGLVVAVDTGAELVSVDFNPRYTFQDIGYEVTVESVVSKE